MNEVKYIDRYYRICTAECYVYIVCTLCVVYKHCECLLFILETSE